MAVGDDMYKAILKEIGAKEGNMSYLFDESDDEDLRGDDHEVYENNQLVEYTRGGIAIQQTNDQNSREGIESDDESLLHQWESEAEDDVVDDPSKIKRDAYEVKTSTENSASKDASVHAGIDKDSSVQQIPAWKKMLQETSAKQQELMGQMINLHKAQKESSPRNKIRNLTAMTYSEKSLYEGGDEGSASSPLVLKEINRNDPNLNLNSSAVSSSSIQQISTRNTKLQGQWQSQQEKSAKLQDKLNIMQTKFYNQQEQWEIEQEELFSPPPRSPTKIPKWHSSTNATNSTVAETDTSQEKPSTISSPKNLHESAYASSQELESSKVLILQLKAQLEESRKIQQSQQDELSDCKDRLKKRDFEHQALLLRYETEKKSWKEEMNDNQAQHDIELQTRDSELEDTRHKLHQQIAVNQDLRGRHEDESSTVALKEELASVKNQMKLEMEQNQKHSAHIQELEDENHRLKTDFTRKQELERTQQEIKSQMKVAIEEQTKKTREFQSRIRELEGRHAEELEYWKKEVDSHRQQVELNSTRMESQLEDANARYAELERKHDKEVKEWQLLLDADITKEVAGESGFEDHESKKDLMAIGAGNTIAESLSPIRKVQSMYARQRNDEGHESINMIDDLLQEIGEMDLERTAILKEINGEDDNGHALSAQVGNKAEGSLRSATMETRLDGESEYPKPTELPDSSVDDPGRKNMNQSDSTNDSEVLDETLHLLNNLKTMLTSQGNEHETTVIERLEVLSELMQSQDQSQRDSGNNVSYISSRDEAPFAITMPRGETNNSSWISTVDAAAPTDPWPALVAELKNRCEFLERDRDEVTRITEQILEMERASHKAELEAAVATAERKANETLQRLQLESNQEMDSFYQNICFQYQQDAFDFSNGQEGIDA